MDKALLELLARLASLSDVQMADVESQLTAHIEDLAGRESLDDETMQLLTEAGERLAEVRTLMSERAAAEAERRSRAEEILAQARATTEEATEEPESDPAAEEPAEEPESDPAAEEPAEEPAAEPAVAAAAPIIPPRPRIERVAARVPARNRPRLADPSRPVITAAADIPGTPAGRELDSLLAAAPVMAARMHTFSGPASMREQVPVIKITQPYPAERRLSVADPRANMALIAAVTSPDALTASGGLCAPVAVNYELANISVADRPVRDSLAQFNADRGGIRFIEPMQLVDYSSAVDAWTVANDENPADPATKPCLHVDCGVETTVNIEAITRCLEFGNLNARSFPEMIAEAMAKTMVVHGRFAERRLLASIRTNSTQVTAETVLGASRDILTTLDRAAWTYRNRHRTRRTMPLRLIAPELAFSLIRADLARELPGATAERLAMAEAQIAEFFSVRNINVTWTLEWREGSGLDVGTQGVGPLIGWPTNIEMALFHEGAHLFLDGGELDLGLVRDSTLNSTNDYQMFAETFEATAMTGLESLWIDLDVCPDGSTSATVDIDPCASGS